MAAAPTYDVFQAIADPTRRQDWSKSARSAVKCATPYNQHRSKNCANGCPTTNVSGRISYMLSSVW